MSVETRIAGERLHKFAKTLCIGLLIFSIVIYVLFYQYYNSPSFKVISEYGSVILAKK